MLWQEIKKHLYECDDLEFAGNRDKLFADVDYLLSHQKEKLREGVIKERSKWTKCKDRKSVV